MKALVTGASGFIGQRLLQSLLEQGARVSALSRRKRKAENPNLEWVQGDIVNASSLDSVFSRSSYDVLFHLAGLVSFDQRNKDELLKINELGAKNILTSAKTFGIPTTIFVSSAATIGPLSDKQIADESTPFLWDQNLHPYSYSKFRGEEVAKEFASSGLRVVIVNPTFVFGEGDTHTPAMRLLQKLQLRKAPLYPPGGSCIVWVEDVVKAILALVEKGQPGERYILGGENISHRAAYRHIAKVVGGHPPFLPFPASLLHLYGWLAEIEATVRHKIPRYTRAWARGARTFHYYSSDKAKQVFDYNPLGFRETIQNTSDWMKKEKLLS